LLGESLGGLAELLLAAGEPFALSESESLPDFDEAEEELEPDPLPEPDAEEDLELFWLLLADSSSEADEFLSESEFSESLKFD